MVNRNLVTVYDAAAHGWHYELLALEATLNTRALLSAYLQKIQPGHADLTK